MFGEGWRNFGKHFALLLRPAKHKELRLSFGLAIALPDVRGGLGGV